MNFTWRITNRKHSLWLDFLGGKSLLMDSFMSTEPSLLTAAPWTFSLLESQCVSSPWSVWLRLIMANPCLAHVQTFFLTELSLSIYKTHSFVHRWPGIESQVKSYQRLKKWFLIPPCLTLSIIRYGSRVKWNNLGKGVVPYPTPRCSSYWKESLWVILD